MEMKNLLQPQLDTIAFWALSKLSEDQSREIQFIVSITPKCFPGAYEYFLNYYKELKIHLDIDAVETFLWTQGKL